jgi:hypothetical protein
MMTKQPINLTTVHYDFESIGIPPMGMPDCMSVYIVQDGYTRQFYADTHEKFLAVATQSFSNETDAYSYTRNHGVVDTLTAMIALTFDSNDCMAAERKQFDSLVAKEVVRMLTKGDSK